MQSLRMDSTVFMRHLRREDNKARRLLEDDDGWGLIFQPSRGEKRNRLKAVLLGVAAEERIGLPARTRGIVGGVHEKAADNFFIESGGSEILGLAQVVGRRVVAVGEPVLENLLFGRAEHKAVVHLDGGNAFDDEAVLVAANEAIAKRLLIGDGFDAERSGDGGGAVTEIGFFEAFHFEKFERNDGEKHVDVDVGGDGCGGDGRPGGEIARAEETFFLAGNEDEEK